MELKLRNQCIAFSFYQGIDVGKICSETSLRGNEFAELESQCRILKEESLSERQLTNIGDLNENKSQQQQKQQQPQLQQQRQKKQPQENKPNHEHNTETDEVRKLRDENARMKEIYEDHMRVCANTARIARKSSSATLQHCNSEAVDELKKKVHNLKCSNDELQRRLNDKASECFNLYEELGRLRHANSVRYKLFIRLKIFF